MGISVGGGDKKSRNLDLNLVPMIDLMSCMTAFLLVTAVWQQTATVDAQPKKDGNGQIKGVDEQEVYSVLVRPDGILMADRRTHAVRSFGDVRDFGAGLADAWAEQGSPADAQLEIAGDSSDGAPVLYQQLVDAMTVGRTAGLTHIDVVDPRQLTTSPVSPASGG
jgi:biopolymer transport protein ExbD